MIGEGVGPRAGFTRLAVRRNLRVNISDIWQASGLPRQTTKDISQREPAGPLSATPYSFGTRAGLPALSPGAPVRVGGTGSPAHCLRFGMVIHVVWAGGSNQVS